MLQQTIAHPVEISGIGAHSGEVSSLFIKPAPANYGIKFIRIDCNNAVIEAQYDNVSNTKLCTVVANKDGIKVSTIEHLMSALWALGIDNANIEINNEEVPILDGSAKIFYDTIATVGTIKQTGSYRKYVKVLRKVEVQCGDKYLCMEPADALMLNIKIDFDHPMIGTQIAVLEEDGDYANEISAARTFGFVKEVEYLRSMGLAKGASTDNAIALTASGILNEELRYHNEFAKHKLLDCVGDLYLGGYIKARVTGYKVSHELNNRLMRVLFSDAANYEIVEHCNVVEQKKAMNTQPYYAIYGNAVTV